MNRKMVFHICGQMMLLEAVLMLLPLVTALFYGEKCVFSFVASMGIALALGAVMMLANKPKDTVIYSREGFCITALTWVIFSLVGSLPFVISGEIPSFVDAFFETVSGFTTTGASILRDIESMSKGLLMWRSFTHWVGGMGILVMVMAVLPMTTDRSIHIMRAEMPGPIVGKLVPRVRQTAKILYVIYIGLTLLQIALLLAGGMNLFEAMIHTFGTAGTGGFSCNSDSIAGYSPYIQWVITIFMFIFGINFNLYYLALIRRFKSVFTSEELWAYTGIVAVSVAAVAINIRPLYESLGETLRYAAFQVMTIVSTSGFATADFNLWPQLSRSILCLLMFIGACAGSTAGGLKVSRVVMLFKAVKRELKKMLHPRSVSAVRFEGKPLEDSTLSGVCIYFAFYMAITLGVFLLISFEPFDFETKFTSVLACFNNVGPGLGAVGPIGNYADYTAFSKIVLSVSMLLGRLEIYPIIFLLSPSVWFRKR